VRRPTLWVGTPNDFDFWLGTWDARWEHDGAEAHGTNTITKRYEGRVVHEQFDGRPGMDFQGMSVSVYSEPLDRWLQTWVDDEGNYWALDGVFDDGEMTLLCRDGAIDYRMRFFDIRDDAFEWSWERSDDDCASWRLVWNIHYTRV
jgi:hypothetical protein